MGSTYKRSFAKGACWELVSFILTLLFLFTFYENLLRSLKLTIVLTIIKIPFFFLHERFWKKIKWGKIPTELYKGKIDKNSS